MTCFKITVLSASLAASILPATSSAQSFTNADIERISIVGARQTVQQNQLASASYILDETDITNSGQIFLIDILRGMPGISVSKSGSIGGLTELRLRGAETNHLLVMIDGIVVNDEGQGGLVDFAHITTENVVSVELLNGPQSALWGSGAVAGVLSITTRNASKTSKRLGVSYGNNQTLKANAHYANSSSDSVNYFVGIEHFDSDGENVSRAGNEDDGYENTTASAGFDWKASDDHQFSSQIRYVDYSNDFDATDFFTTGLPIDADNTAEGNRLNGKLDYQYAPENSDWQHNVEYQFSRANSENYSAGILSAETDARKHRAIYWNTLSLLNSGHVNTGIEWVRDDFRQRGPIGFGDPNQDQTMTTRAVFADAIVGISDDISINASGRLDRNSDFDNQTSYRLGINYVISDVLRSFVSYGKAVRNPTFTERFGFFPGTFLGNPDLNPEIANSLEVGVEYQASNDSRLQINWFDSQLEDEINGFVFDADFGGFTAANSANESSRQGIELSYAYTLKTWNFSASYTYLDASEEATTGISTTELRRAKHSGSVSINYSPNSPLSVNLSAAYTGSRFDQFFPPFPQPSEIVGLRPYTLVNTNVVYQMGDSASIQLSAHNLFDETYEDVVGFVGKGRQVSVGMRYLFD
jgi:vitamin B12 transporter